MEDVTAQLQALLGRQQGGQSGSRQEGAESAGGRILVELVGGRSVGTTAYAAYPLKLMLPSKVALGGVDAVWVYAITYGGGIVAGDTVALSVTVCDSCTAAITTQSSTKVYHSDGKKVAEQRLRASVGTGALLALLPDPVTCFKDALYRQEQSFDVAPGGSLVLVDWLTSGRRGRGEVWEFEKYESCNRVYLGGGGSPVLLDRVVLEKGGQLAVAERMHGCHVIAMVALFGPRTAEARASMEAGTRQVAQSATRHLRTLAGAARRAAPPSSSTQTGVQVYASCSPIGPDGDGLLVRIAALSTEAVYKFLREYLAPLACHIGVPPYSSLG